jgi:hypothetical protein
MTGAYLKVLFLNLLEKKRLNPWLGQLITFYFLKD